MAGGGSGGGRIGVLGVKQVINDTVKVRAVEEEIIVGRGNRRELERISVLRRRRGRIEKRRE